MSKKTILLTGASGLFGLEITKGLLNNNYNVVAITSKQETKLKLEEQFKEHVSANSLKTIIIDLMSDEFIDELSLLLESVEIYSFIHAARSTKFLKIEQNDLISRDNFLAEYHLGVYVPYAISMFLSSRKNNKLENIINIASIYGVVGPTPSLYDNFHKQSAINYGVAKAALIHLTKELSIRLSSKNIRVNAISYGGVEGRVDKEFVERYSKLNPCGKMLRKEDIFESILFLISNKSSSINGHNLMVDGGWTTW